MPRPVPNAVKLLAIAVSAGLLTAFFFCPCFLRWKGLGTITSEFVKEPAVSRAIATLNQIDDLQVPIGFPVHRVIKWRLLFPLLWHVLGLPKWFFLWMPFVGCVLALWLFAKLAEQYLRPWRSLWLATVLFAALPWFFVSTGWLAYFDSWLVLALLVVAFVPSRWALGAACLLAPWVDERILFALPACLAIRAVALNREPKSLVRDAVPIAATIFPYLAARFVSWQQGEPLIGEYIDLHRRDLQMVPWSQLWLGVWMSYRAAWTMIAAAIWFVWRSRGPRVGLIFAAILCATTVVGLFVAQDMVRTLMVICPAVLLGIALWHSRHPRSFRWILPITVAANLLLPAAHVVWQFNVPIFYLYSELEFLRHPPGLWNPDTYVERAAAALNRNDDAAMAQAIEASLQLDPNNADAHVLRAILRLRQHDVDRAEEEIALVLADRPDFSDALVVRAMIEQRRGDTQAARADAQKALDNAPAGWLRRNDAENLLKRLP